ncbi:hypothetical protein B0J17DRAFT_42867 [Rhizoctonia solani]|nr:hypothetical protein B0J17DRAFT_42867 [Rhizoctonia solani]
MPMAFARSTTGCLACKTKRKKCDETKPHCLRCQKSHIECPGYIYVQNPNKPNGKLRTVPAPRTALGRSQATEHYEALLVVTEGPGIQSQAQLAQGKDLVTTDASCSVTSSSVAPNTRTLSESHDMPNVGVSSSSLDDSLQHSSIDYNISHELVVKTTIPDPIRPPQSMSAGTPMTSGQVSLLNRYYSLWWLNSSVGSVWRPMCHTSCPGSI